MAADPAFDLKKLRRNWSEPEATKSGNCRCRLKPASLPVDFLTEVPVQLSALREACESEFSSHMMVLDLFLQEVEQAGRVLAAVQSSTPSSQKPSGENLLVEVVEDEFAQEPQQRFNDALSSLEELLEVFMIDH